MLNKKRILMFIVIGCCAVTSACSFKNKSNNMTRRIDEDKVSEEHTDIIIDALRNKDADKIKTLFSKNALSQADSIDEDIDYILEYYKGKLQCIETSVPVVSDSIEHGEKQKILQCETHIRTDKGEYDLYFEDIVVDTKDSDNIGLSYLHLLKEEEVEKYLYDEYKKIGVLNPSQISDEEIENRRKEVYEMNPEFFDEYPEALEHFRLFEKYPNVFKEEPNVFELHPSILDNLDFFEAYPEELENDPGFYDE